MSEKIHFILSHWKPKNQKKIWFFFLKNKSSFLKFSFVFFVKTKVKVKAFVLWKKIVLVFVVLFMTWGKKIGKWNNQSRFLGISKCNPGPLFYITMDTLFFFIYGNWFQVSLFFLVEVCCFQNCIDDSSLLRMINKY